MLCNHCGRRMIFIYLVLRDFSKNIPSLCAVQHLGYFTSIESWRNITNPVVEWDPALLVLHVATFLLAYTLCLLRLGILTSFYFLPFETMFIFSTTCCTTCNQHQQGPVFPIIDYSFAALCLWPISIMLFSLTFSTHKILWSKKVLWQKSALPTCFQKQGIFYCSVL